MLISPFNLLSGLVLDAIGCCSAHGCSLRVHNSRRYDGGAWSGSGAVNDPGINGLVNDPGINGLLARSTSTCTS